MPENNYSAMTDLFSKTFGGRKVAIFPLDHGGAVQAARLRPYLREAGINFVLYEREGAAMPQENCIDQGNLHLFGEVRQIVTPRRHVKRFLRNTEDVNDIVVLDDWANSHGMPSLSGGYVYFVMLGYPTAKTAVFRDRCGGADISPDVQSDQKYNGTWDYIRYNNPATYHYLLQNGYMPHESEDKFFEWLDDKSSWLEKVKLYAIRRADQLLVTPIAKRRRRGDFVKDAADRMFKSAALL